MAYTYLACDLITGNVRERVELVGVQAQRTLSQANPGAFTADMPLGGVDPVIAQSRIDATEPGRSTIVILRDGVALGEWIIWGYADRKNDGSPIKLQGTYITSYFDQVEPNFSAATGDLPLLGWPAATDQITIATRLAAQCQDPITNTKAPLGSRGMTFTIPTIPLSGVLVKQTDWPGKGQKVGQMLQLLSEVENGFDWDIDVNVVGQQVVRTLNLSYPRRGIDAGIVLQPAQGSRGGNIVSINWPSDGSRVKTQIIGVGAGTGISGQLMDYEPARTDTLTAQQAQLVAVFPLMQADYSDTSINLPAALKARTRSRGMGARSSKVPPDVTILANVNPVLGSYQCGDYMTLVIGASTNFPTGFQQKLRLSSFTIAPPTAGAETVALALADIVEVY